MNCNSLIVLCILAASSTAFVVQPAATRVSSVALFAKKKKGKTSPKQQKKGGFEWASSFVLQPYEAKAVRELAATAVASFKGRAGHHLIQELETSADIPKILWNAPAMACVIVRPGDADASQTMVQYANIAALETVGLKPKEFQELFSTGAPPAAPPKEEEETDEVVADEQPPTDLTSTTTIQLNLPPVMKGDTKFERGYSKKMLKQDDSKGGDITIINAYRWDLEKSTLVGGKFVTTSVGVAYAWSEWMVGETLLCRPGGVQEVVEDLGDLDDKIAQQGAVIRGLKENQGLGNKDPQVVAAVAELLRLRSLKETE